MQFKVPQKIDMEDKIIGPLTMKQFVALLVGGMITYATIKSYNTTLFIFVGIPVAVLALCIAFIKIQDQPFTKFLYSFALFMTKPKQRIWKKDWKKYEMTKTIVQSTDKKIEKHEDKIVRKDQLEQLSGILDKHGNLDA